MKSINICLKEVICDNYNNILKGVKDKSFNEKELQEELNYNRISKNIFKVIENKLMGEPNQFDDSKEML